jgi:hypothetical protein
MTSTSATSTMLARINTTVARLETRGVVAVIDCSF